MQKDAHLIQIFHLDQLKMGTQMTSTVYVMEKRKNLVQIIEAKSPEELELPSLMNSWSLWKTSLKVPAIFRSVRGSI